ncbi:hypothetical protein [Aetokthonos hydrillicola]|uniref:hypothetical protein n=1 Tax=Aetokthonos hydrillicola TaxID=1550245 RepID=UPI001ABACDB7
MSITALAKAIVSAFRQEFSSTNPLSVSGGSNIADTGSGSTTSTTTRTVAATDSPEVVAIGQVRDRLPSTLGPKSSTNSTSVVLASDQTTIPVTGSVSVSNLPSTQTVSGSVTVSNLPNNQAVTVSNFPLTQPVSLTTLPALSAGTNAIGSITNTSFSATQSGTWSVGVNNFPTSFNIGNFPSSQSVSGAISIVDPVTSTNRLSVDSQGRLTVANFPTNQTVSGNISIADSTTPTNRVGVNSSGQMSIVDTNTGTQSDSAATTDTGTFSLISLFKRLLGTYLSSINTKLPSLSSGRIPVETSPLLIAVTPTIGIINLTNANQEYSQALTNIKKLAFKVRSGGDIRYSYSSGVVASGTNYYTCVSTNEETEDLAANFTFSGTLYFASSTAGTVIEYKYWS